MAAAAEELTPAQLLVEAQLLYEQGESVRPAWEQLGDVTRSVWTDRVLAGERAVLW
jgi:hypothetical protein